MDQLLKKRTQDLAKENFANIRLFQHYNIDFYCHGGLTLEKALSNSKVQSDKFIEELKAIQEQPKKEYVVDIKNWPLDLLSDYIQKTHHRFTDQILVEIKEKTNEYLIQELPYSNEIEAFKILFEQLAKELGAHMKREELLLFPTIKKIVNTRDKIDDPGDKTVKNPVDQMIHEHDTQNQLVEKIRRRLNNYVIDGEKPQAYRDIIHLMEKLDLDLSLHLHLENNILFPKAVELESSKLN